MIKNWGYSVEVRQIRYSEIKEGDAGVAQTIKAIDEMVKLASVDWDIITLAREIVREVPAHDKEGEADELFWWVKENIKFMNDPIEAELLQTPQVTIQQGFGDCDDFVILLAALNKAIGNDVVYLTIALPREKDFSHIFLAVYFFDTQKVKRYDATVSQSEPGWTPPSYGRIRAWYNDRVFKNLGLSGLCSTLAEILDPFYKWTARLLQKAGLSIIDHMLRKIDEIVNDFEQDVGLDKLGPFGKYLFDVPLKSGIDAAANVFGIPEIIPGQAISQMLPDNPMALTQQDIDLIGSVALVVGSAILSIVGGAGIPLLISSIVSLINTAMSAVDLANEIKKRQDLIDQLKNQRAILSIEARAQREAIAKLQADITLIQMVFSWIQDEEANITKIKAAFGDTISQIKYEADKMILTAQEESDQDIANFQANLLTEMKQDLTSKATTMLSDISDAKKQLGLTLSDSEKTEITNEFNTIIAGVTL